MKFEEESIPYFDLAPRECSSPKQFEDVKVMMNALFSMIFLIIFLLKMIFLYMNHNLGPSGMKKLYTQLKN